jgi:hypothetical protein
MAPRTGYSSVNATFSNAYRIFMPDEKVSSFFMADGLYLRKHRLCREHAFLYEQESFGATGHCKEGDLQQMWHA